MEAQVIFEIEKPEDALSNTVVEEAMRQLLPRRLKEFLRKPTNRHLLKEKFGDKAFLLPEKLKFPIVDDKGKPNCALIYAARVRAKQWASKKSEYAEVAKKAEELYKKNKCSTKLHLKLHEHDEVVEFFDFLDLFDL